MFVGFHAADQMMYQYDKKNLPGLPGRRISI